MNARPDIAQADPLDHWRGRLAGEKLPVHDGVPECGFYRKRKVRGGPWLPASIFLDGAGTLSAEVNGEPADPVQIWTHLVKNPVTEEAYRFHVDHNRWPDDAVQSGAASSDNPRVHVGGNNPPDELALESEADQSAAAAAKTGEEQPADPEVDTLIAEFEEVKKAARDVYAQLKPGAPLAVANRAQNIRDQLKSISKRFNDLRDTRGRPYLEAKRAIDAYFKEYVDNPLTVEKMIGPRVIAWQAAERDRLRAEAEAEAKRIAEEQAKARAEQDRLAAERHQPDAAEPPAPASPPPEPVHVPPVEVRAPLLGGAVGRRRGLRRVKVAVIEDQDAFYRTMRSNPDLVALLQKLANKVGEVHAEGTRVSGLFITGKDA